MTLKKELLDIDANHLVQTIKTVLEQGIEIQDSTAAQNYERFADTYPGLCTAVNRLMDENLYAGTERGLGLALGAHVAVMALARLADEEEYIMAVPNPTPDL